MIKKLAFSILLSLTGNIIAAPYQGRVFVDKNQNNQWDKGEKTLKGVLVSDGLNVTETDADGKYTLPGHVGERFIFITTPSGYQTYNRHYHPISDKQQESYDFALTSYQAHADKKGAHRFIHISDTEIFNTTGNDIWVENLRQYAANEEVAFIIHTGDICYEKGLTEHIQLMNTRNMNLPIFYCIGNHDLVKGKYGEELFEKMYGPVYYSFEVGNTHYIVTPMPGGDYRPGYTRKEVCNWLRNDLAHVKPGMSVIVFNHDLLTTGNEFIYKGGEGDSINLNNHNLKAWLYGHWHVHDIRKQGDVYSICTSSLDKGGIDHSTTAYRVIDVDQNGDIGSTLRYAYLNNHLHIASPCGKCGHNTVTVNAYSSEASIRSITYTCLINGKPILKDKILHPVTDWTWNAELPLKSLPIGEELTLKVHACFNDGTTADAQQEFTYLPGKVDIQLTDNRDNLLGNAAHAAPTAQALDSVLYLAWTKNVGDNIYMTSPLIHDGRIYTASSDENLKGKAAVYALNGQDGEIIWRYPVKNAIKNTIAIEENLVFAQDVDGNLYAIDCQSGQLRWQTQLPLKGMPALISGLCAENGVVYAGTGEGLCAFKATDGQLIWRNKYWTQGEGTTTTLTQGNGILIGSAQWNALYGNDARNGQMLWSRSENGLRNRGASAAMHGNLLYLISDQSFFILEAGTGRTIIRKKLPYSVDVTSTPLLTDREIIFGTAEKGLVALDNQTLEEIWNTPIGYSLIYTTPYSRPQSSTIETSPVLAGNTVYVGTSDGTVYGIDKTKGNVTWKYTTGAPIFGSVAVSGNTLIVTDFGGNVYAFTGINP